MKILILGGTGAMGTHLVQNLAKNGIDTFVTTRSKKESKKHITYLQGNAKDLSFLEPILSEYWDAIVDFMVYSTVQFKNRINLLLSATNQYIFISSARVFANTDRVITENTDRLLDTINDEDYLSTDEYALSKARQEDLLKSSDKNNWTIIRPYITYSENRLQLGVLEKEEWLYRALKGRSIVFSKDIAQSATTITYGADVAMGIFSIIGKQEALGDVFNITSVESYTWKELLAKYIDIFKNVKGFEPKVKIVDMKQFLPVHPAKYQINYDRLFNRSFDNTKISKFIGKYQFTETDEGLIKCLTEFIEYPDFKLINWEREALKDKLTNERTPLIEISGWKYKILYLWFRYLPYKFVNRMKNLVS